MKTLTDLALKIHVNYEYVNYLSLVDAVKKRLVYTEGNTSFVLKTDSTTILDPLRGGRDSVRLRSKRSFNRGLFIADIQHMPPQVCGLWPSLFLIGPTWPTDGEIDIIEGVNIMMNNQITIHSKPGCAPTVGAGGEKGNRTGYKDCGDGNGDIGCGVFDTGRYGYGGMMNMAGGGVHALLWTADAIQVWHWPRGRVPADALIGNPKPASWGVPVANWGGCRFDDHFRNMNVVSRKFCSSSPQTHTRGFHWVRFLTYGDADCANDVLRRVGRQDMGQGSVQGGCADVRGFCGQAPARLCGSVLEDQLYQSI
jgi:hypothetical protein